MATRRGTPALAKLASEGMTSNYRGVDRCKGYHTVCQFECQDILPLGSFFPFGRLGQSHWQIINHEIHKAHENISRSTFFLFRVFCVFRG
jgi:hypothetical protein